MFPHLMGMKEYNHLSSKDMGAIIGKSRQTYEVKMAQGNFTVFECKALCRYFKVGFDYLFATMDELTGAENCAISTDPAADGEKGTDTQQEAM